MRWEVVPDEPLQDYKTGPAERNILHTLLKAISDLQAENTRVQTINLHSKWRDILHSNPWFCHSYSYPIMSESITIWGTQVTFSPHMQEDRALLWFHVDDNSGPLFANVLNGYKFVNLP